MKKMLAFMAANGLAFEAVRWFGFNNPGPTPASPNYGYDVWITVGADVQGEGEGEVEILGFEGGLYAVTRLEDLSNIGKVWQQLVLWREDSRYQPGQHQWLENLLTPPDTPYDEYVFDLYLPIVE